MLAALALPGIARASGGPAYQAATATAATAPTIDGTLSPGEWNATTYSVTLDRPGFGSIPASVQFEQTATDLYVGVVVHDLAPGPRPSLGVYFDNNHDGHKDTGDDLWLNFVGSAGQDFFWDPTVGSHVADLGSDDTIASGTSTTGAVTFEFRHPLCSADTAHDICATPGQLLGVDFQYEPDTAPGVFFDGPGPGTADPGVTWGDLQLASTVGDEVAPTVTLTQPPAGSTLSGRAVSVAANASDNVGVTSVEFQYFDGTTFHDLGTDTDSPYAATFDTTTVANTVPLGGTVYATAHDAAGNSTRVGNGVTVQNSAGALSGSVIASPDPIASPTPVELTVAGNEDWAIWGNVNNALTPNVRKSGGSAISDLTNIDPEPIAVLRALGPRTDSPPPFLFSWSDGGSQPVGAGVHAGIQHDGAQTNVSTLGKGFSFDVPASTVPRTLTIYVATNRANGELTASLSDRSAGAYVDTLPSASDTRSGLYTIHYAAASTGQTLHVQWVETSDQCSAFRCDNAALYAVALSGPPAGSGIPDGATADLKTGRAVTMSGADVPLGGIPLGAFEPAAGAQTVNGAPINTLPINTLPINTLPINTLPINTLPINTLPINTLPINTLPINTLPINTLPINTLGGWTALLAGTSLAGVPLQTITLAQVQSQAPTAYNRLHLGDLDVSQSALGRVSIGALALGVAPINTLGLSPTDLADLTTWCASATKDLNGGATTQCAATPLGSRSLFELSLEGAPINTLPINTLPINTLPINTLPINTLPINTLDVSASPINTLPINTLVPVNALDVFASPINTLPLQGILAAGSPSPFGAITIASLAHPGQVCAGACPYGTLGEAFAAGAILTSARLGDILEAVGSLTLGDLHFYGSLTIGDLEQSLPGTTQFGDLLGLLIRRSDVPWETLPARALSAFDPARPELALNAHFTFVGAGVTPATVKIALPDGFDYVPGSATLTTAGGGAQPLGAPDVGPHSVGWLLPAVTLGNEYVLAFHAYSGTTVGTTEATETIKAGGSAATSTASFAVGDSFEPNDSADSLSTTQTIPPDDSVQQSALPSAGDVDYYRVPMPAAGTRIHVHLANLAADYDLALYANRTTSVRTAASTGLALQDGAVADQSIDLLGGTNPQLTPTALQDVPDPGIPVVQVSANRGTDDEDAGLIAPGGGGYLTIAVFGYNGASSPQPYSLRVTTTPAPAPVCTPRSLPALGQGVAGTLPAASAVPTDLNTVFIVDEKRIGDTYGLPGENSVVGALTRLAGEGALGVSGAVIPVEALAQSQYTAWDANPCDNDAANAVANAIANQIATLKASHPSLKYVVFVGGDDQVPFFRVPDLSRIANESGFADSFHGNEYAGALSAGNLLSDNPYLDTRPIPASGRQLFVPDLVGGRLVEKPAQIVAAVTRYESAHGRLDNSSAFVSGYDFVSDGSQRVQQNLNSTLGTGATRTLIGNTWSKSDLLAAAFPVGGAAAINSWNGHYDNYEALAANGDHSALLSTADLTGVHALSGGIFFTMGCHAGFQTTDAIVGATAPDALDWAESFAQSGTGFVGNTGFGLGNTDSVAFSEELMADFAGHLGGALSIGEALARAKQDYYLGRTAFSSYDEKTLAEAELYGLPMYGVGVNAAPLRPALAPSPDPVTGAVSSTSPTQGALAPLAGTAAQVASFDVAPRFEAAPLNGAHGQYFTNGGQVQAPNYRPLQPFVTLGATRSGATAHGVLVDALTSGDVLSFDPDNVRPTVDLSANEPEPQFSEEAWPEKVPTLVSLAGADGLQQSLNLTTGQFFNDADTHSGVERLWTHIGGRVTYSTSSDFTPPSIESVDAFVANGVVTFTGHFSDLTETGAAGTVGLAQVVYDVDGAGHWRALPLQLDPATGAWSGGAAFTGVHVQFFVEACDTAGNCGFSSNKGRYFDAQPIPAAGGALTLTPSRAPDSGAFYTGPVTVEAAGAGATGIQTSLDGGPFSDATSVTVTGDGSHTIDARGSDGTEARTVVLVDATAPEATIAVPATVPQGTATRLQLTCTDRGSGVDSCRPTQDGIPRAVGDLLDTSRVGASTISVEVRDNAGNHRTVSATFTVVDTTPPVLTLPASVVADAPTSAGTIVSFTATALDAVDGVVPVTCAPASGSTFATGDTIVRCQASDHAGNVGSGSFTVHVRDYRDQIAKVRAEIAAAAATAPASTATRLRAALALLDDAGKPVNWSDGLRLLAPRGGLVYVDLELTLDVLQAARGGSVPAATLDDWSKRLTRAGDEIARTAVADAVLAHGTAAKITSAQKTLTLAQTAIAAGNLRLAVVDDAASWVLAEQAMKKLP